MTGSSSASPARRSLPPASLSASRASCSASSVSANTGKARPKARWSCSCSIATASPITKRWRKPSAPRISAPCVVIQGGYEKAKGEVQIKDLVLGAKLTALDRDEYLKKQEEAQILVPEAQLVENVRAVLARHKG